MRDIFLQKAFFKHALNSLSVTMYSIIFPDAGKLRNITQMLQKLNKSVEKITKYVILDLRKK